MINDVPVDFFFNNFLPKQTKIPSIKELHSQELSEEGDIHFKLKNNSISILRVNRTHSLDELRLNWFLNFLNESLNKNKFDLNCEFLINISDGTGKNSFSKFCFSQARDCNNILIPDPHNFATNHKIKILADIPFNKKINKAIFIGSATGQPIHKNLNLRELAAIKNINSKFSDIKIIPVHGYAEKEKIEKKLKEEQLNGNIFSEYISIQDQLKYKIILNIDGHTTSWERPLWIMASNSICINIKPYKIFESWYSDLLYFYQAIPELDLNSIDYFISQNNFETDFWKNLKNKQKFIAEKISNIDNQMLYLNSVIKYYNEQFNLINK